MRYGDYKNSFSRVDEDEPIEIGAMQPLAIESGKADVSDLFSSSQPAMNTAKVSPEKILSVKVPIPPFIEPPISRASNASELASGISGVHPVEVQEV